MRRCGSEAVRCVAWERAAATERGLALTDTPIYDQIRQELEADRAEPLARRSRADESNQAVSVWALVNQHRNGKH